MNSLNKNKEIGYKTYAAKLKILMKKLKKITKRWMWKNTKKFVNDGIGKSNKKKRDIDCIRHKNNNNTILTEK